MLFADTKTLAGKIHFGRFHIHSEEDHVGRLNLDNPKRPTLQLLHNDPTSWVGVQHPPAIIRGELTCGTKVTLFVSNTQVNSVSVSLDYVVGGRQHLPESDSIVQIQFTIDDAGSLKWDPVFLGSAEGDHNDQTGTIEWNWLTEIFQADTVIGRVSAGYRWDVPSPRMLPPHPSDLHIQADVIITLEFSSDQSLESAVNSTRKVVNFLATISEAPTAIVQMALGLESTSSSKLELIPPPYYLPVYDRVSTERVVEPIVKDGASMSSLITNWIALGEGTIVDGSAQDRRWKARKHYHTSCLLKNHVYDEDRLVSAANLFDLLPKSAVVTDFELSPEVEAGIDAARCAFKNLVKEDDVYHTRNRCLSALTRLKHPRLKDRVRARAKIVQDEVDLELEKIGLITDRAVNLRNLYVHESDSDAETPLGLLVVCTATLEFVFVVSELIEAGWDVNAAREFYRSRHPVKMYANYYKEYFTKFCDVAI